MLHHTQIHLFLTTKFSEHTSPSLFGRHVLKRMNQSSFITTRINEFLHAQVRPFVSKIKIKLIKLKNKLKKNA